MAVNIATLIDGAAVSLDISKATAAADDEVFAVIFADGATFRTYRCVNVPGGSADQLQISAGVKYIMKVSESDAKALLGTTGTYKIYKRSSGAYALLESGTLNVGAGDAVPTVPAEIKMEVFKVTESFTANGTMEFAFPSGSILLGLMLKNYGAEAGTVDVTIDGINYADDIAVGSGEIASLSVTSNTRAVPTITDIGISSASWTDVDMDLTIIYGK